MTFGLLGDHAEILSGFAFKSDAFNTDGNGTPLIRIRDVMPGRTSTFFDGEFDNRFLIGSGEILIGMDGDFNRARWASEPALLNQRVCKISAHTKLDDGYLYYLLPQILKVISDRTAFVTVKHLSAKDLRETEIPLPPLEEQKRIAGILDQADTLRRLRTRALDKLNTLGQAIFHEMFGDGANTEKAWPIVELADLIAEDDRISYGVVQPGDHDPKGIPLIRVADLAAPLINFDEVKRVSNQIDYEYSRSRLRGGEILIGCVGSIGTAIIAPKSFEGSNIARAVARVSIDPNRCNPAFLLQFIKSDEVQRYFTKEVRLVAQPTLNIKQIRETKVPLPPRELQDAFASRIGNVLSSKTALVSASKSTESLFASLQHRAFRGGL